MSKYIVDLEGKISEKKIGQMYKGKIYFNKDVDYLFYEFLQFTMQPNLLNCDWFMKVDGMVEKIVNYCVENRCLDVNQVFSRLANAELSVYGYGDVKRQIQDFDLAKSRALGILESNVYNVRPSICYVIGFLTYFNLI